MRQFCSPGGTSRLWRVLLVPWLPFSCWLCCTRALSTTASTCSGRRTICLSIDRWRDPSGIRRHHACRHQPQQRRHPCSEYHSTALLGRPPRFHFSCSWACLAFFICLDLCLSVPSSVNIESNAYYFYVFSLSISFSLPPFTVKSLSLFAERVHHLYHKQNAPALM